MASGEFQLNSKEEQIIVRKIAEIEKTTTSEVRVHLASKSSRRAVWEDAKRTFHKLGMHETRERNSVLVFIRTKSRELAFYADTGLERHIPQDFWKQLIEATLSHYRKSDFLVGTLHALDTIRLPLAQLFPLRGTENPNEISDEVSRD